MKGVIKMAQTKTTAAEAAQEAKRVTLDEIAVGGIFNYAGYNWVKLTEVFQDSSLSLMAESVGDRAFDVNDHNDWRKSSLRKWLNHGNNGSYTEDYDIDDERGYGFFVELMKNGANLEDFADVISDLTADDGMTDYGEATDTVALLSCDQYRRYRKLIPALDDWWWTLTPWTCLASSSCIVRRVLTTGALTNDLAFYGHYGVRPLCNLKSGILVSPVSED
jgi:hypothetical protein